jgi:hypothetical protein
MTTAGLAGEATGALFPAGWGEIAEPRKASQRRFLRLDFPANQIVTPRVTPSLLFSSSPLILLALER